MPTSGSSKGRAGAGGGSCPGLELPSPGSGGAGPSLEPPLDLGAVPVAEMKDSLKS